MGRSSSEDTDSSSEADKGGESNAFLNADKDFFSSSSSGRIGRTGRAFREGESGGSDFSFAKLGVDFEVLNRLPLL